MHWTQNEAQAPSERGQAAACFADYAVIDFHGPTRGFALPKCKQHCDSSGQLRESTDSQAGISNSFCSAISMLEMVKGIGLHSIVPLQYHH
jgi:hypothetical protein